MKSRKSTAEKKAAFLQALEGSLNVGHAARLALIGRRTAYTWREEDEAFAAAWDAALETAIDALEQTLYERAMRSDTVAAIFLLKGNRGGKYRERHELTGKDGGPLVTVVLKEGEDVP